MVLTCPLLGVVGIICYETPKTPKTQNRKTNMARKITVQELEDVEGQSALSILEEVMFDTRHCPAMCSEGCEVEVDGVCPHGHQSLALEMGVV